MRGGGPGYGWGRFRVPKGGGSMAVELATAYVSLVASTKGLGRQVAKAVRDVDSTVEVDADTAGAQTKMSGVATTARRLDAMNPTIKVDADTGAAQAKLSALNSSTVSASAGVSGLAAAGLALGPAIVPAAAAGAAGIAAMGAAGAAGAAGIGVATLALGGLGDVVSKVSEAQASGTKEQKKAAQEALRALGPAREGFARFLLSLRSGFGELRSQAAKGLLPGLEEGMRRALEAVKPFKGLIGDLAQAMGDMAARAGSALQGAAFQDFFKMMDRTAVGTLETMGSILGNVARGFAGLAVAFQPVATDVLNGLDKLTQKFAAFANQGEGGGLSKFVAYVQRMGPKVVSMIGAIAGAFGKIMVAMAPWGEFVIGAITKLANGIASLPVGVLRALMGTVIALTLAWKLATVAARGMAAAQGVWNAAQKIGVLWTNRSVAAQKLKLIWTKAITVATKAWAVAQRVLNAVLRMNPLGLIVTGIMLLVGGLILAYKKSETFRRIVNNAWKSIKKWAMDAVNWFKNTAWPWMKQVFKGIGQWAMRMWRSYIKPAFTYLWDLIKKVAGWLKNTAWPWIKGVFRGIGRVARWLWRNAIKPTFNFIWDIAKKVFGWIKNTGWPWIKAAFRAIGRVAKWLWKNGIKPVFNFIWDIAKKVFRWIKDTGVKWIRTAFDWIVDKVQKSWQGWKRIFNWIWDKAKAVFRWIKDTGVKWIRRAFNDIKSKAEWLWDKVEWVFDKLKAGVDKVKDAFGKAKDGIKRAWSKILGAVKSPIKDALSWLNRNFIGKLNDMLGKIPGVSFSIPEIPGFSGGGMVDHPNIPFARGGYTGPGAKMQPAGIVHAGEYVMSKKATNRLRRTIGIDGLNHMNQTGQMPGYAKGGIVALGKKIQRMGYDVSEHPAFGGVVPGAHSPTGYHYTGGALDINADAWNSKFSNEKSALDRLNAMLRGSGWNTIWRAPNHFDHLHVDIGNGGGGGGFLPDWLTSPASWLKGKALDLIKGVTGDKFGIAGKVLPGVAKKMMSGIAGKIKDQFDFLGFGPSGGGGGGGSNRAIGKRIAQNMGWGGAQWRALEELWTRESNWSHTARNPSSGAYGIPQALPASKMAAAGGDWRTNPVTQIQWGLSYIKRRYGSPMDALWFHNLHNWYDTGGLVQPAVFDNGGTLAPGLNMVHNKTGKPEPLVRPEQAAPNVRVFIGDQELTDIVRTEIDFADGFKDSRSRMGAH